MSSQLASIVPIVPLTDEVFPFNQDAFIQIRKYQEKSVSYFYVETQLTHSYIFPVI